VKTRGSALVVGGLGGLGTPTVHALVDAGIDVVVADRRADDFGAWLAAQPEGLADHVSFEPADVAKEEGVDDLRERLRARDVHVSYLVPMQAAVPDAAVWDLPVRHWHAAIRVSLDGSFLLARAFGQDMAGAGFGRIVNFASMFAYNMPKHQTAYAASKGGVVALTRALAVELAEHGITANAVVPGLIWHEGLRGLFSDEAFQALEDQVPAGRAGRPQEIAAVVRFLCSDDAGFINGQTIHVNGGAYMPG
jgi:NAD(P)-dependent dehydrogenase (short-subunit alcohol dehydrogenase family)